MAKKKESSLVTLLLLTVLIGVYLYQERNGALNPQVDLPEHPYSDQIDLPDDPQRIRIATFNIQVLGQSKLQKPEAISVLGRIIEQFDVVAVQELRSREMNVIPDFVKIINRNGARYDFVIGPRLGRTTSKEQYVYLYDQSRIELLPPSPYTAKTNDRLHRDPFVARFRVKGVPQEEAFTFTLMNIHTDPDETKTELNALDDVFLKVQQENPPEDDFIMLGDLNVDNRHLGELGEIPGMQWVVTGNTPTNTKETEQYDNILFLKDRTREFLGAAYVYNFRERFNLSAEAADDVSDHFPVWAEFSTRESR